jgi:hypothetical protein
VEIEKGWGRLSADGTTVLRNGEIRVRGTIQASTRTVHLDTRTSAGYTRVAIDLDTGSVVAVTTGRTSKVAYDAMLSKLPRRT